MSAQNNENFDWKMLEETMLHNLPKTFSALSRKKYVAPARAELYQNWDKVKLHEIGMLYAAKSFLEGEYSQNIRQTSQFLLHYNMLEKGRVIYVEPEIGEALLKTETPGDFSTEDIPWAYSCFKLMLPKGLLSFEGKNVAFIDGGIFREGETLRFPPSYKETEVFSDSSFRQNDNDVMIWDIFFDDVKSLSLYGYDQWGGKFLREMNQITLRESARIKEEENELIKQAGRLVLNTVLLLKAKPEYLEKGKTLRKPNERKKISELRQGHALGSFLISRKSTKSSSESGLTQDPQVRKGHWKLQPYGKGGSLRKVIWIHPYQTKRDAD